MSGSFRTAVAGCFLLLVGCSEPQHPEVVVYTSVDQIFSEPLLARFEEETGIEVKAVYDAEAQKTVGLEKRLLAEREQPRADVFWNSEFLRTLRLAETGLFTPYASPEAADIPLQFRSPDGLWTGFGVRARVFVVNTDQVSDPETPRSLEALTAPEWRDRACIAKPYFGTTSTHFSALYGRLGAEEYADFLTSLRGNGVRLLAGNSTVRDAVVKGDCAFGLTDTDDVNVALQNGEPVRMVFPDQAGEGAFAVFHTVGLVKNGPHPDAARRLIDYLVSMNNEQALIGSGAVQLSVRDGEEGQPRLWTHTTALLESLEPSADLVREHLDL